MANAPGGASSEGYYKSQFERLEKENKALKQKVELLDKENRDLKKSVYDLSIRYNMSLKNNQKPFDIDNIVEGVANAEMSSTTPSNERRHTTDEGNSKMKTRLNPTDGRLLYFQSDLKGHTGSVYSVKFSPDGQFLASGSFDKSVRVWDIDKHNQEVMALHEHTLNVSDVDWSNDSKKLLSGGYDHCVKLWDLREKKLEESFEYGGFVLSVLFNPSDPSKFFVGTTNNEIHVVDSVSKTSSVLANDSMVNSLYAYRDGNRLLSGDNNGMLKIWDLRKGAVVECIPNASSPAPISHVHAMTSDTDEEGRFLAVNSYDNLLRIYDRGSFMRKDRGVGNAASSLNLIHSLKGYKNKNWPIRSSFFRGQDYQGIGEWQKRKRVGGDDEDEDQHHRRPDNIDETLMLATGSADTSAYVFDIGGPEGSAELVQKLEGHRDRVYAVNFHPHEPILATCSADYSVKIWTPKILTSE